jgi:hypothetical protein
VNERPIRQKRTSETIACLVAGALMLSYASPAAAAKPPTGAVDAAKPDLAAAKKHYADGERKFKAGDFAGALSDFQVANEIKSTPQAERYLGLCEQSLGHPQEAASWYEKFLTHVPEKMAMQGDEIRRRATDLKALPGKVHIDSNPPGASVLIDGKPQPAPTPTDVELAPGAHSIKWTEQGHLPTEKQIDVPFGSTQTVTGDLAVEPPAAPPPPPEAVAVAPPPPASPPPPPPPPRSKVPAFVTGGLAIAAAGVGTVFGVMALSDKSDFDKNPTAQTADNGDTHALIADMAFGVALTFGVTSAVLFLTKDEQPAPPPAAAKAAPKVEEAKSRGVTVTPVPWVGPRSGGAGLVLRF